MAPDFNMAWLDGDIQPRASARLPLDARAFRYGDAVFSTLRCESGRVLAAGRHMARLRGACERIGLTPPPLVDDLPGLGDIAGRLGILDRPAVLRIQVSARAAGRGFGRGGCAASTLVEALPAPPDRGLRVRVQSPDADLPPPALPDVKSSSAISHVLAAREAEAQDADDLIRLASLSITEAVSSNVFWLTRGMLYTPDDTLPLYPGVTRATVIEAANSLGIPLETGRYGPEELRPVDAAFLTNAVRGVEAIEELEGRRLGTNETLAALAEASLSLRIAEGVDVTSGPER